MKTEAKWICGGICIAVIVSVILVFSFRETLLLEAGKFMAPEANHMEGLADVVILEGAQFISRGIISKGIELLSSGKARHMAILLHRIKPSAWPFAVNEDYPSSIRRDLHSLGLKDSDFTIIVTHIHDPITLTAAQGALEVLSRDDVKRAILVSPGFHMRRSFLVYQHLSLPLNIKIYPVACFDKYQLGTWWHDEYGVRDFVAELQKLVLYLVKGYIPLKLSY